MTREDSIIELGQWLTTPAGQYLLRWEQDRLDHAVADIFGFHALQVGLPEMDGLRANRMPHRWVATDELVVPELLPVPEPSDSLISTQALPMLSTLHCDPEALPFPEQSLDLVLLPHTLERAVDPHLALAEVARVLRPEGRVVIVGLNPTSAWALRQRAGRMRQGMGLKRSPLFLPPEGEFIGYWRARDWLRLLGFEIEHGQFGCWRLPVQSPTWLQRLAWMDRLGEHWWPVLGASYIMVAVKRVPGMRLVGLKRRALKGQRAAAPAVAGRRALKE
ncbi:class I SAM-dependent methyltransferase [Ideonella paludis]|uniref:Class I SAM-dependent methyltransferase n=1 Tax=Ideonella paludis TaxID=1233411 RepID=A0ABS5DUP1_9BURK|nr:class I SAM-dependent methyltransferase [Ideonella paludis]MBQ0934846.1 class I SAM-dependent methyltransferase [Ideonella paludis]